MLLGPRGNLFNPVLGISCGGFAGDLGEHGVKEFITRLTLVKQNERFEICVLSGFSSARSARDRASEHAR